MNWNSTAEQQVEVIDVTETKSDKKRKEKSKRHDGGGEIKKASQSKKLATKGDGTAQYEEKVPRKERETTSAAVAAEPDNDADGGKELKKKKKKKSGTKHDTVKEDAQSDEPPEQDRGVEKGKTKPKTKKMAKSEIVSATKPTPTLEDGTKKEKNKKRKVHDAVGPEDEVVAAVAPAADESQRPKKKKRKDSRRISDPNDDNALSEQARRALAYAYTQHNHPSEWKFNKARQNWLIRNVWSPKSIPDEHLPLTVWYLKNVQGRIRDALVKSCQTNLQPSIEIQNNGETNPAESTPDTNGTNSSPAPLFGLSPATLVRPSDAGVIKRSRAQIILEALGIL
ncbi:hypothetical protein AX17_001320 [Amanita inopinata Kibby_2008]|nr:hypothetical protein AX17_001320 [Amanita inopinata Kibby_2008]